MAFPLGVQWMPRLHQAKRVSVYRVEISLLKTSPLAYGRLWCRGCCGAVYGGGWMKQNMAVRTIKTEIIINNKKKQNFIRIKINTTEQIIWSHP